LYSVGHTPTIDLTPTQPQRKPLTERKGLVMTGVLNVSPRVAGLVHSGYGWRTTRSSGLGGGRRFG
jgi:hypothetical protein